MYVDILSVLALRGPLKLTHVMYKANVNCSILKEYLESLIQQGLVEEPLSVIEFPTEIRFTPGENASINTVIANSANTNYEVHLIITLSDTEYQQSYVQVSNYTYLVTPGNNTLSAWIAVSQNAPPSNQQLNVDFLRY
jgi:hypothetical protein